MKSIEFYYDFGSPTAYLAWTQLEKAMGIQRKVKRNISISEWYNYLSKTYVGLVFYEPISSSNLNMNMTSQKMNNLIMANIPMVVNNNIDFNHENLLYYVKTKPNPFSISKKINYLLTNKVIFKKMTNNLKILFFKSQNLEFETKNFIKFIDK